MVLAGLMADQSAPRGTALMEANLDRLANMIVDMDRGASNQGFDHIWELCQACVASWTKSEDPAATM